MNKCLRITFATNFPEGFLQNFVQKNAKKLDLEGVVQMMSTENKTLVIVCGNKEKVDSFLDILHKGTTKFVPEEIEVEPFLKDKDYRGVFRIVE